MIRIVNGIAQVGFFLGVSALMNRLTGWLGWPIPGSILGIALVVLLLRFGVVRLEWVELGAGWLLGEMLLFFIPSATGVIRFQDLLVSSGPRILIVLLCSTAAVMGFSGWIAQAVAARKERRPV